MLTHLGALSEARMVSVRDTCLLTQEVRSFEVGRVEVLRWISTTSPAEPAIQLLTR